MKIPTFVSRTILVLGVAALLVLATGCNPHPHPSQPAAAPTNGKDGPREAKDTPILRNPGPHN